MDSPTQLITHSTSVIKTYDSKHLKYLDGIRAVAALYVLIHHILIQIDYGKSAYSVLLISIFQYGRFAVDVFIVLSGFCLMLPLTKGNTIHLTNNFLKRRAIRILPTYYIAMALSLFLIYTIIGKKTGSHWDESIPVTAWDIFTHIFLIQDLFGETVYKINHTFWSISVECRIYLVFPLIILLCRKFGIVLITLASLLLSFFLWHGYSYIGLNSYTMSPHYLSLFMFGMLSSYVSFTKEKFYTVLKDMYLQYVTLILIIFIVSMVVIVPNLFHTISLTTLTADYTVGACTAILLLSISAGRMNVLTKALSWHPLVFVGTFAYSIYLIHAPVLQIISQYLVLPMNLSQPLNLLSMIILGISINLLVSYLFFILAEKPYLKKRSLIKAL
jgi:peptidoglycan/LPS O-acetylase OafA/YrhL